MQFSYVGPQTSINFPSQDGQETPESILLSPGSIVELPKEALELDQVIRLQQLGHLIPAENSQPVASEKRSSRTAKAEGGQE